MTFSLISVAVLFIAVLIILIEVVRAVNRGFRKTLITLASLFLAVFSSIVITNFTSDFFARFSASLIKSLIDISDFSEKLPSIIKIITAYADALVAPIVFLVTFFVMRGIIAIVMAIVNKAVSKRLESGKYEPEDAPNYRKKPNLTNGLLGALCGLMVVVICISPVMGSIKIIGKTFNNMNANTDALGIRIKSSVTQYVDKCSNDLVGNVFYYCGGNLIYRSTASSKLNENYFGIEREIDGTFNTLNDIMNVSNTINNLGSATEEEKNELRNLGSNINKAETLKTVAADIVPVLAKKWANNEPYEGVEKPKVNKAANTFFNQMLHVCKQSTSETVGDDLSTLINVYIIAFENDILASENYKEMLEQAKKTGAFDLIKKELEKNPRMAGISLELDNMTIRSVATAIQSFNIENYDALMGDVTDTLNKAMKLEGQERLDYVNDLTKSYIHQYGIDIGDDVAEEISARLVEELVDHRNTEITVDDIKAFMDKYSVKASGPSGSGNNSSTVLPTPDDETENDGVVEEDPSTEDVGNGDENEYIPDEIYPDDGFGDNITDETGGEGDISGEDPWTETGDIWY